MIAEVNLTGAALLGVDRKKLINRRFAIFVTAGKRDYWNQHFLSVLQSDGRQSCELEFQLDDGSLLRTRLDCLRMETDGLSSVRIALADLTIK